MIDQPPRPPQAAEADPNAVMSAADASVRAGHFDEALRGYLWCFDHGGAAAGFSGVRQSFLIDRILALGAKYPPALEGLKERRRLLETEVTRKASTNQPMRDVDMLVTLNAALGHDERSVQTYDMVARLLGPDAELRVDLLQEVLPQLIDSKRYAKIVGEREVFVRRIEKIDGLIRRKRAGAAELHSAIEQKALGEFAEYLVDFAGAYFEALLGTGDKNTARTVAADLISLDGSAATYAALVSRAMRAGDQEFAKALFDRGMRELPEGARPVLVKAAHGLQS